MDEPLLRTWSGGRHPGRRGRRRLRRPAGPRRRAVDRHRRLALPAGHPGGVLAARRSRPRRLAPVHRPGGGPLPFHRRTPPGGDQRADDACSACFEFPVAGEPVELLGTPRVTLLLRLGVPHGQAVARLCDVAPDGTSTRIALGALALSARHGTERAHAWPPGATEPVSFALAAAGHTFRPGHRIRLAVSSAYWPWLWPADDTAAGFVLVPEGSHLELPVRERRNGPSTAREPAPEREPEQAEPPLVGAAGTLEGERPARLLIREPGTGVHRSETVPVPGGTRVHPDGLEVTEEALQTWTIRAHDPLSAHALTVWRTRLHRPALPWDTTVETRSEIRCDADDFVLRDEVVCRDGREIVFHRTWEKRIPRLAG
nr:CocE/NonD family hydrolase C-terminal non-catalytic domain-containing protein [Streptomyces clavuligerus]